MSRNSILATIFDHVAAGDNSRYWMAVFMGYNQLPPTINSPEEAKGYRIGLSLSGTL